MVKMFLSLFYGLEVLENFEDVFIASAGAFPIAVAAEVESDIADAAATPIVRAETRFDRGGHLPHFNLYYTHYGI